MQRAAAELPIEALRADFLAALARGHVVVGASTGSGKSTRLPVWAAEQGPVLVVEPRRVAAVQLARWLASRAGEAPGGTYGYAVRHDRCHGPETRVVFVTPGVALRWHAENRLAAFRVVLLDEFHERRWDTDLLLALLAAEGRHDLVLTSATLDVAGLSDWLRATPLQAEGRAYPVEVRHAAEDPRAMPSRRSLATRVVDAVREVLAGESGDVLVFLPGRGEIDAAVQALRGVDADVIPLHGGSSLDEQNRALETGPGRRVIVATNVAETSLTIPGVTAVIDSGLERRTQRRNGRTVLSLEAVSQAAAEQRRGRAGRIAPGSCLRLWGERAPLPERAAPEVQREDLTELALAAGCAGHPAGELSFPDPPREESLARAVSTLRELDALDADGRATDRGRALFALPVDPVLAHLVTAMPDPLTKAFAADLVAALSVGRDWVRAPRDEDEHRTLAASINRACDATLRVTALRDPDAAGVAVQRAGRMEARRLSESLHDALGLDPDPKAPPDPAVLERALTALARAFPPLVHVRRERRRQTLGNGEGEVWLPERTLLAADAEAALVLDAHSVPGRGTRATHTVATCLAPVPLVALADPALADPEVTGAQWDGERMYARRRWYRAARCVAEEVIEPQGEELRRAAAERILDGGLLAPAGDRLRDDLEAWALWVALGYAEAGSDARVPEAETWLIGQLASLGVETAGDLTLLEPEDLAFPGVPEWERARFDERFPRRVDLSDLSMKVHYEPRRREVIVEKEGGVRRTDPRRWELPAWSGWRVKFRRASREVEIR